MTPDALVGSARPSSLSTAHAFNDDEPPALTVVGAGIKVVDQVTTEARNAIAAAGVVFHSTQIPGMAQWLQAMKPNCVDLTQFYAAGRDRWVTYRMMVDRVLRDVDDGVRVCAVFYGHPAVYVTPSHDMIKEVRARGLRAHMLPGISAEDCLFADLGVDPGVNGWQSYDVTPFLVFHPRFEPSAGLVLWQMDVLGHRDYQPKQQRSNYDVLARELAKTYGWEHEVIGYYAAQYPGLDPLIDTMTVAELAAHDGMSTLYVPPVGRLAADRAMLSELGMIHERLGEPASSRS